MLSLWLALGAALLAGPGENALMTPCTGTRVAPGAGTLAKALAEAPADATLCLAAGEYEAQVELARSVTLVGEPGRTILKGTGRGPVLSVPDDDLAVRVQGVTFSGAVARAGAAVSLGGSSRVTLADCAFVDNRAGAHGGGALYARHGQLEVTNGRFEGNQGAQGGAVLLDGVARARFAGCTFEGNQGERGGAVRVLEGVQATFEGCTFRANRSPEAGSALRVAGSASRVPQVTLTGCTLEGDTLGADVPFGGTVRVSRSTVPPHTFDVPGVVDADSNPSK